MKLTLTLTAETDVDNAKIVEVASQFGGTVEAKEPVKAEKAVKEEAGTKEPVKAEKAVKEEAETKKPVKAEKAAKGKKASAEDSGVTIKDVRKVFTRLLDTLGDDEGPAAGKKLLKKFNAKDIPSVDPEHYQSIIDDAESLIREAQNTADADEDESDDLGIDSEDDGDDE